MSTWTLFKEPLINNMTAQEIAKYVIRSTNGDEIWQEGYDKAINDGQKDYDEGYDEGVEETRKETSKEAYASGFDAGLAEGISRGTKDTSELWDRAISELDERIQRWVKAKLEKVREGDRAGVR